MKIYNLRFWSRQNRFQLNSGKVSVFDDIYCTIEWTVILVFSENFQENKILNLKTANILNFNPYVQFHNLKSETIKKVSFLSFLRLLFLVFGPQESNGGFEASRPKFQNFQNFEEESIRGGTELLGKVGQRGRGPLNKILKKIQFDWKSDSHFYGTLE